MAVNVDGVKHLEHKNKYGLMGKGTSYTFAANTKILNDPNVFIGYTGTTSDTTNSKYGFVNVKKATSDDSIVDTSGNSISGNIVGDIKGTVCDKSGQEVATVTIKDVVHMSGSSYNLFSLTKRLDQG
eukprot:4233105-Ditylum_brightwellii.AAC.1